MLASPPANAHNQRITARSAMAPPKIMETFFLAEEKHAIRTQSFHDHLTRPVCDG
jgi:hypothetical protein